MNRFFINATGINTDGAASLHDFFNQKLDSQSTVLFASYCVPILQEGRSGRKKDQGFEAGLLKQQVNAKTRPEQSPATIAARWRV